MAENILITGGTGKIGRKLAVHFLEQGWNVSITTRNKKQAEESFKSENKTGRLSILEVDFNTEHAVDSIIHYFENNSALFPTVLVNNARSLEFLKVGENGLSSKENILGEYRVDVVVPYELSMKLSRIKKSALRNIINVSSMYGIVPFNPHLYDNYEQSAPIQYSLAKSALIHLTKELAVRLAKQKIRVNTVSYGGVEGRSDEAFKKRYAGFCPDEKMLTEEEVIGPVAFLASDQSRGMTGHNLVQDGGWTIW